MATKQEAFSHISLTMLSIGMIGDFYMNIFFSFYYEWLSAVSINISHTDAKRKHYMEIYLLTIFSRSAKTGATNFWREALKILVLKKAGI